MNTKWTVLETQVTPKRLRLWAESLEREMQAAFIGNEVPAIEIKCWDTKTNIVLRADQKAWNNRDKGSWS